MTERFSPVDSDLCPHIASAVEDTSLMDKYSTVVKWQTHRTQITRHVSKRRKITIPDCGTCNTVLARPFACLHCSYNGCWPSGHIQEHLKSAGHSFCVDARTGSVYCSSCNDMVFSQKLDSIRLSAVLSAEEQQTRFQVSKRHREPFKPWVPKAEDIAALEGTEPVVCQGRRGLLNLGQTCFLNVILQSFIHNPLLRNYFLSDKHNSSQCSTEDCACCEMDKLFTETYSNETAPYGPVSFLVTTWRKSAELAGYAQQDAHEFFISALNQIHSSSRGSTNVSCNCIIHSTFSGQLQSDVVCERCGNVTSTVDPMLDISLELKGKGGEPASGDNTLVACLRRFTHPEKLGPKEYSCSRCSKNSHEATKRLTIRKLPPVLSFQFKRFEQKSTDKGLARKLDSLIRFPTTLNMAPYTTFYMKEAEKENNGELPSHPGPDAMYEYDLFAVINHKGELNNGHYTNFARYQDEWYRFDDDKVTHSALEECLKSSAYMCFYVKRHLDYKPHVVPSYVLTRELEASREKELEKEQEAARMKELEDALLATV